MVSRKGWRTSGSEGEPGSGAHFRAAWQAGWDTSNAPLARTVPSLPHRRPPETSSPSCPLRVEYGDVSLTIGTILPVESAEEIVEFAAVAEGLPPMEEDICIDRSKPPALNFGFQEPCRAAKALQGSRS